MKFLPYQKRWIEDKSRLKILVKGRRVGGSFATSYAVWKELMDKRNHDIIICTRDENLAVEFVGMVKKWVSLWNLSCKNQKDVVPPSCMKRLSLEIPHRDGTTRLIAVSSNPNAILGKGGSLILDEFAVANDPELLWSLAQPIIMAGGNCSILSTHRSRNTLFNRLVKEAENDPDSEWSLHRTTLEDAVEQGLMETIVNPTLIKLGNDPFDTSEDFIAWIKKTTDEHTYSQEYMCIPSESGTCLLKLGELENAYQRLKDKGSLKTGQYYVGYDVAESIEGDYATICVVRAFESEVELVETHYFEKGTMIEDQLEKVKSISKKYNAYRIICDSNGIGRYPASVLKKKLGDHKVVAFVNTMNSKAEGYTKVKRFFENGRVRMVEDTQVQTDFLSIERTITPSNNIIYTAIKTMGSHGDMCSAYMMALTEVPENFNVTIQGVKTIPTKRAEPSPTQETIHDRIARNRKLDKIAKKRFTM